jgi:hypothetical protein
LAIVLCSFNDVPVLDIPRVRFFDFISQYGRGGLFDFWRDVSYGAIDLSGSEVFGWYTMQYSFIHDGKTKGRFDWIAEAFRLAGNDGVDLSRFHSVIAVVNANVDDSNAGRNTAMAIGGAWGQTNWRWCQKCGGLGYGGDATQGRCPAGGQHDFSASANYALSINDASFPGQDNWRWCRKCEGLSYNGNPSPGPCPAGGTHDHTGSADYRLGMGTVGYPGQNLWKWCQKCQGLGYSGNPAGPCPATGIHDYSASADYTLVMVGSGLNTTFNAHETGHCYGLAHSWSANPDVEYGDPWDIMSAMRVRAFDNHEYAPAGPGLNAPTLYKLGWLSDDRVFTFRPAPGVPNQTVQLVALNRPELSGYLMARVVTPNHVYTAEFRQTTGWDTGIGRDGVLIHELRSNYTTGQNYWRWCDKCQGLNYAGWSICPAGGVHDHSSTFNYKLAINDPGFAGQHGWRWCGKCQGLAFLSSSPGPCPAGGAHDHTGSADYGLALDNAGAPGQKSWKWCNKCQGLAYAANSTPGACPAGGIHDHSGSGDYTLAHDTTGNGQDQWSWCSKCQGLAYNGYSVCTAGGAHHTVSFDYAIAINDPAFPGQNLWKWCRKCFGLAYSGGAAGPCKAGGNHDPSASADYSLLHDVGGANGQNQWRWCKKCQLLAYGGNPPGPCPAGGNHDHSSSADYTLANFSQDRTFLIQADWQPGQVFADNARNVRIAITSFNSGASMATLSIGDAVGLSPSPTLSLPGGWLPKTGA